jgi:hypothetical protein
MVNKQSFAGHVRWAVLMATLLVFVGYGMTRVNSGHAATQPVLGVMNHTPSSNGLGTGGLGASWERIERDWNVVEARQGIYDWSQYDSQLASARANNVKVLGVVLAAPAWAALGGCNTGNGCQPSGSTNFAKFMRQAAMHYRGQMGA